MDTRNPYPQKHSRKWKHYIKFIFYKIPIVMFQKSCSNPWEKFVNAYNIMIYYDLIIVNLIKPAYNVPERS